MDLGKPPPRTTQYDSSGVWKGCTNCHSQPASYYCVDCINAHSVDKTRYCNRDCQRKDWARHKKYCKASLLMDAKIALEARAVGLPVEWSWIRYRQMDRWIMPLGQTISWVVRQVFKTSPIKIPRDVVLFIEMISADATNPQSPLWPCRYTLKRATLEGEESTNGETVPEPRAFFSVSIDGYQYKSGAAALDNYTQRHLGVLSPNWPWIFGLCCLMGDINPLIARVRLKLVLDTLIDLNDANYYLEEFVAPTFWDSFEISWESMDKWMRIMYPVTASFQSRYRPPCDFVPKRYKRLL